MVRHTDTEITIMKEEFIILTVLEKQESWHVGPRGKHQGEMDGQTEREGSCGKEPLLWFP